MECNSMSKLFFVIFFVRSSCDIWVGGVDVCQTSEVTFFLSSATQLIGPLDSRRSWQPSATSAQNQLLPVAKLPLKDLPSLKLTARPWKWMVGILLSYWGGLFSVAMLVSGRVKVKCIILYCSLFRGFVVGAMFFVFLFLQIVLTCPEFWSVFVILYIRWLRMKWSRGTQKSLKIPISQHQWLRDIGCEGFFVVLWGKPKEWGRFYLKFGNIWPPKTSPRKDTYFLGVGIIQIWFDVFQGGSGWRKKKSMRFACPATDVMWFLKTLTLWLRSKKKCRNEHRRRTIVMNKLSTA